MRTELEFLQQEYNDTQEAIAQVARMVGIDPENWDNDSCPNNSDMLKEIIQHMEEIDKEIDEEALKSPDLTVKGAFELAGHPVPDGAKITSTIISIEGKDKSDWQSWERDWFYATDSETAYFNGSKWDTSEPENHILEKIVIGQAMDISNLPAADCLSALPQVVRSSVEGSKS